MPSTTKKGLDIAEAGGVPAVLRDLRGSYLELGKGVGVEEEYIVSKI